MDKITLEQALDYEIRSSRIASWIGWGWLQRISANYFANKAIRKIKRYNQSYDWQRRFEFRSETKINK
jgi:hypothetical protein